MEHGGVWPITASALVTNGPNGMDGMVIFGDQAGFIYGLDRNSGQTYLITRQEQKNGSSGAGMWSSPTYDPTTDTVSASSSSNTSKRSASCNGCPRISPISFEQPKMGPAGRRPAAIRPHMTALLANDTPPAIRGMLKRWPASRSYLQAGFRHCFQ
jgi:hypothetical protein